MGCDHRADTDIREINRRRYRKTRRNISRGLLCINHMLCALRTKRRVSDFDAHDFARINRTTCDFEIYDITLSYEVWRRCRDWGGVIGRSRYLPLRTIFPPE